MAAESMSVNMFQKIEKRGKCSHCETGNQWSVELPEVIWVDYWQWAKEHGWDVPDYSLATQCEQCGTVNIFPAEEPID